MPPAAASRVIVIVYVFIVEPSSAVTVIVIVFEPSVRDCVPPPTTVAPASFLVAVTVTLETLFATVAV
ncbi:hypothetical protein FACS1894202_14970 [Clostridia bacterium]|nr:hypothetical protein FACS1894202_14970 [Clostridia bacterium]